METQVEATKARQTTIDRRHRIPDQEDSQREPILGELLKLGIKVAKSTIQRYIYQVRSPLSTKQTWATFLRNHAKDIWAVDFLQTHDLSFRAIFVFVVIELGCRRLVHFGVTRSPTGAWVAQQLREATCAG